MIPAALVLLASIGAAPSLDPAALGLAQRALVAKEALRLKLERAPATAARLAQLRTDAGVEQLVKEKAGASPTEADLRAAYHSATDGARLEGVILRTPEDAAAAKERLDHGAALAEEAKASVEPVARQSKGDLGWVPRSAMPAPMAQAVFTGAGNEPVGPFKVDAGWAVVRVLERRLGDDAGFTRERAALLADLETRAAQRARADLLAKLRGPVPPKLDDGFIAAAAERVATAEDRKKVVARVGQQAITYGAIVDSAASSHGGAATATKFPPEMLKGIARRLVDRALLDAEARRVGAGRRPEAVKAYERGREDVLVAAYYQQVAAQVAEPGEAELNAWFEQHRAEFKTGDAVPKLDDVRDRVSAAYRFERISGELRTRISALEAAAPRGAHR